MMALRNLFKSVIKVHPQAFENISSESKGYMGVKNVPYISDEFIQFMERKGYLLHTVDKASLGGRAIDFDLQNPITGRPMTGSSSGTAINVFLEINDIGVGTDGGGSVLGPAMALNLIGIIHPGFNRFSKEVVKQSTDNISFVPTIGFMTKKLTILEEIFSIFDLIHDFEEFELMNPLKIGSDCQIDLNELKVETAKIDLSYKYTSSREELISNLKEMLGHFDIVISKEGPIDLVGIGDSILGHFDSTTREIQMKSNKGFLKVVNMCGLVGLTVPSENLGTGYLIMCSPENEQAMKMVVKIAQKLCTVNDEMSANYFRKTELYWQDGILV